MTETVLGYGDTSGHSGGETSEERVRRDDASGATGARQRTVLELLAFWSYNGITVSELRQETGWHHGQASAALSNLHKAGLVARLTTRRSRCFVYVLPSEVGARDVEPYGTRVSGKPLLTELEQAQVSGARRAAEVNPESPGFAGVPQWRVQNLIDIIDRLTS